MERKPKIAILRWEEGLVPQGLMQLEELPGNSTNPKSYPFPVRMIHVPGACVETVITHPSQELLENMISICKKLRDEEGILAISTSCGFNAVFQQKLAEGPKCQFSRRLCCRFRLCKTSSEKSNGRSSDRKQGSTHKRTFSCLRNYR